MGTIRQSNAKEQIINQTVNFKLLPKLIYNYTECIWCYVTDLGCIFAVNVDRDDQSISNICFQFVTRPLLHRGTRLNPTKMYIYTKYIFYITINNADAIKPTIRIIFSPYSFFPSPSLLLFNIYRLHIIAKNNITIHIFTIY